MGILSGRIMLSSRHGSICSNRNIDLWRIDAFLINELLFRRKNPGAPRGGETRRNFLPPPGYSSAVCGIIMIYGIIVIIILIIIMSPQELPQQQKSPPHEESCCGGVDICVVETWGVAGPSLVTE